MKPLALVPAPVQAPALERPLPKVDSKATGAAQQFEQIFLRQLVGSLMQSAKLGGRSQMAGSGVYDSMVVDALATSLSARGGIGLAKLVQGRMEEASAAEAASLLAPADMATGGLSSGSGPIPLPTSRAAGGPATFLEIDSSIPQASRLSPAQVQDRMAQRRNR